MEKNNIFEGLITEEQQKIVDVLRDETEKFGYRTNIYLNVGSFEYYLTKANTAEDADKAYQSWVEEEFSRFQKLTDKLQRMMDMVESLDLDTTKKKCQELVEKRKEALKHVEYETIIEIYLKEAKYYNGYNTDKMIVTAETREKGKFKATIKHYEIAVLNKKNTVQALNAVKEFIAEHSELDIQKAYIHHDFMRSEYNKIFKEVILTEDVR